MVLEVCKYERRELGGAGSLVTKGCVDVEALYCRGEDVLE